MSADSERYLPPNEPATFESLCLDLWKEIWEDPGAQKNGRSGQSQAGVDVFGVYRGRQMGVQCKQKNGLLRTRLTVRELNEEVEQALKFEPRLDTFILATSGPADAKVQKRARKITADHKPEGLFKVEIWSWDKIWHEIHGREALWQRIFPIYWPRSSALEGRRVAPTRLTHGAARLFGRDDELANLDAAWADPKTHLVTLVAWGGVGKTALVAKWAARLAARDYGGASYFDWSFYSQGTRETGGPSSDTFIAAALRFFGDAEMARSPVSAWDKGARLARLVAERRTLLVLDGLEPLQHPPGPLAGQLKDPAVTALLKGLAATNPGLCLVTTRESVFDLASFRDTTAPEWQLGHLSTSSGVELLETLGVHGPADELVQLVQDVNGHALTLNLLGQFLARAHGGDVRRRDRVQLERADLKTQGGHAFKTMAAYESWLAAGGEDGARQLAVLRLLGLFARPADVGCLAVLRREPIIAGLTDPLVDVDEDDWNLTVRTLAECGLVPPSSSEASSLDVHPLIREYFARQLREHNTDAWRDAHGRLFEHLQENTKHQPETLEGLQPLYQAVGHGCQAGRQQEACDRVYTDRILRGQENYSTFKLGAIGADLGAIACFFERPWSRISPSLTEDYQAWLLNEAAFNLRALGRLNEALKPMRSGLQMRIEQKVWESAAQIATNLSELDLTLGDMTGAVHHAEQSVEFADLGGDAFKRFMCRATLADALHQAGRRADALARFREAEEMQAQFQSSRPLLFSLGSFLYSDLLLAGPESATWQAGSVALSTAGWGRARSRRSRPTPRVALRGLLSWLAGLGFGLRRQDVGAPSGLAQICRDVVQRAAQTLEWAEQSKFQLLVIALDHLTLGRARLYRTILERLDASGVLTQSAIGNARSEIEQAVNGLRRAGQLQFVPLGLLTRARLRSLTGDASGARADLNEAWAIAERGPMPLFQADVHLHRARLFHDRDALAEARRLIEKHGYGRRLEELADAEEAAEHW